MNATISLLLLSISLLFPGSQESAWKTISPKDSGYSVAFPRSPKESTQPVHTDAGTFQLHQTLYTTSQCAFLAAYTDFASSIVEPASVKKILDGARDGAIKSVNGKLIRERKLMIAGYPGREFEVAVQMNMIYRERLFLVKDRFYQVVVVAPKNYEDQDEISKFLESFRLTKS